MDRKRVEKILNDCVGKKIAVVGDLMLDVYIWGKVSRISPEAPVPVVHVRNKTYSLGGAANVMRNIVSLGGHALAFGIIGEGNNGSRLLNLMKKEKVDIANIIIDPDYTTIEKQRIIADSQQLARVDFEEKEPELAEQQKTITKNLLQGIRMGEIEGIIFEDYAKGLLCAEMLTEVILEAEKKNIPVALDPHPSHKMDVKGLTLMTPNHIEAFGLAGVYLKELNCPLTEDSNLKQVAGIINLEWKVKHLLITLGAKGMLLFEEGKTPVHIPTVAREVYDVTGAGDTVIAVNTMSLLGGASAEEAARISNYAAGVVVGHIGTSSVTKEEILNNF